MTLNKTSNGKACGPSEVSAELPRSLGEYGLDWSPETTKDAWNRGNITDYGWINSGTNVQVKRRCYGVWKLSKNEADGTCYEDPPERLLTSMECSLGS